MSALGQKRTCAMQIGMCALPPKADMCSANAHVCYGPKADSCSAAKGWSLFDHLVGDREKIRGDIEAERFGGCEIDDEIDLACQLNRHIGGCRPFENPASVDAGTTIGIGLARSVAHENAGLGEAAIGSARRQRVAKRQRGELSTSADEVWTITDEQRARALLDHRRKSGREFALVGNFHNQDLPANRLTGLLHLLHMEVGSRRGRMKQRGNGD